ncbi:MAG TPA: SE1832 family protein [Rummeliibacillus sp.]|uniref:SE1832 family protein n=1 Tax=Rummeliibacillus pycnus TaxID=101070 RepID=UPI002CA5093E|nr:SE1832 family protein [Rummeliibacillus sp.]
MPTKNELLYQIAELKSDYIRQQGDIEKLESTGYPELIEKAEQRLSDMEKQLAELNKQLEACES